MACNSSYMALRQRNGCAAIANIFELLVNVQRVCIHVQCNINSQSNSTVIQGSSNNISRIITYNINFTAYTCIMLISLTGHRPVNGIKIQVKLYTFQFMQMLAKRCSVCLYIANSYEQHCLEGDFRGKLCISHMSQNGCRPFNR